MDVMIAASYEQKLPCFISGDILDSVSDHHIYMCNMLEHESFNNYNSVYIVVCKLNNSKEVHA
jgi:hypothetical protein